MEPPIQSLAFCPLSASVFRGERPLQEILDLALFGANAIEMIPPGIDDAMQSPNMKVPWLSMLREVSTWCCSKSDVESWWSIRLRGR